MKKWPLNFLLILVASGLGSGINLPNQDNETVPVRVMSFNIRYDNPDDGENSWEKRKKAVIQLIKKYTPGILGVQEALGNQRDDILASLPQYHSVGVARDDGKAMGEYACILVDTSIYRVLSEETFWLSTSPGQPSRSWDAALNRICSYAMLLHRSSGDSLHVYNTHFDHKGEKARRYSAQLIIDRLKTRHGPEDYLILMGDFNAEPKSMPIQIVQSYMFDSSLCSLSGEGAMTYNGWDETRFSGPRLDYIFFRNMDCLSSWIAYERRTERLFVSDHFPVFAILQLN